MTVPIWLGYLMQTGFAVILVAVGLWIIVNIADFLFNVVIPEIWVRRQRMKIKNMGREQFDAYIHALRYEWTEEQITRGQRNESEKD